MESYDVYSIFFPLFLACLVSLTIIILRSIHVMYINSSFFLWSSILFHSFFIHLPIDIHLDHFSCFAVIGKAMHIHVQDFVRTYAFILLW